MLFQWRLVKPWNIIVNFKGQRKERLFPDAGLRIFSEGVVSSRFQAGNGSELDAQTSS